VYRNGAFMRLDGLLPGHPPVSFATGINENGDVAGVFKTNFYTFTSTLPNGKTSLTSPAQQFAFVYSNGQVRQLPDLSGARLMQSTTMATWLAILCCHPTLGPADIPVHAAIFPRDGSIIAARREPGADYCMGPERLPK
jgi:hypothetical protein